MKRTYLFLKCWRVVIVSLLCMPMLSTCAKTGSVSVSIHGVNYTDQEFSYVVEDPADKTNRGGGELIDPFAAGGTMCCYDLPTRWRPGIKIQVNVTRWLPKTADDKLPEVREKHVVEVPPYADGKVGELWVLRSADGTVGVVSSDYQPDHEKWPGKVKGWPVPSVTYQRERWDLHIKLAEDDLESAQQALGEMRDAPARLAAESWETNTRWDSDRKKMLSEFTGSEDPKYRTKLNKDFTQWLERSQLKLKQLRESRP